MKYLLDTCVVSEFTKSQANTGLRHWLDSQGQRALYLSVITVGEIQKGITKLEDAARQSAIQDWLEVLIERFEGRILPIDMEIVRVWGALLGEEQRNGINLPAIDSLIASTAAVHHMTVVSRNVQDFERCHASVLNPWA